MPNFKNCKHCGKKIWEDERPHFHKIQFCNRTCTDAWHNIERAKKRRENQDLAKNEKDRWAATYMRRREKPFGWETRYLNPYLKMRFN